MGRRGQASLGEGRGALRPYHVRRRREAVAVGTGEAADEAASQAGVAEQREQRLGVELAARPPEVRLEEAGRDAEPRVEAVVAEDAGKEPREPITGRAAGGFTRDLEYGRP